MELQGKAFTRVRKEGVFLFSESLYAMNNDKELEKINVKERDLH